MYAYIMCIEIAQETENVALVPTRSIFIIGERKGRERTCKETGGEKGLCALYIEIYI